VTGDTVTCHKCGEELPRRRDLSMHNRIVHGPDALGLYNSPTNNKKSE
jgi:formylmethanofuran dehydrogenase subunit E